MNEFDKSEWVEMKLPCKHCGSSDAYHISQSNGFRSGYCFSCRIHEKLNDNPKKEVALTDKSNDTKTIESILELDSIDLKDRKISRGVTNLYKVRSQVNAEGEELSRYYPITKKGEVVAFKRRVLPKDFSIAGNTGNHIELFGQRLWPNGGKFLVVTVGEEDAMACYQMTSKQSKSGKGYASVSVVNGASAIQNIKNNLEWLERFETIVFAVDQEDLDLGEAEKWCELLTIGKTRIARFEEKDANEMLKSGKEKEFIEALRNSKKYISKDTAFSGLSFDTMLADNREIDCLKYPEVFGLNELLPGFVKGRTDLVASFAKSGKSTVISHFIHHLINCKEKVVLFTTETTTGEVLRKVLQLEIEKNLAQEKDEEVKKYKDVFKKLFGDNDEDSSLIINRCTEIQTPEDLILKLRQCIIGYDAKYIFIDNLTRLLRKFGKSDYNYVAGSLTCDLVELAKNYKAYLCLISHVRKQGTATQVSAKSYEQGRLINVDDIYGSGDLSKEVNNIISISRNNSMDPNVTQLHVIASRDNKTGNGHTLRYNYETTKYEKTLDISKKVCYNKDLTDNNVL